MSETPTRAHKLTIAQAGALFRQKELSPVELLDSVLVRIAETEDKVHAYTIVTEDSARREAAAAENELASGVDKGPLHGIPIGLKDLYYTKDIPTEAGSKVLEGFVPDFDSGVARKLSEGGAVLAGKTWTHEFAYGQNVPPTRNPWQLDCYPGGSSAGSGVSVAVDSVMGAMGTDTGGSIRVPGAVNGIVALKPTFGRVSKYGVIPMSMTMDSTGPLAKTVEDCALMMNVVSGYDPDDPVSLNVPVPDFTADLRKGVKGLRIGVERDYFFYDSTMPAVKEATETAYEIYEDLGAELIEVEIPYVEYAGSAGLTLVIADTASFHQKWLREKANLYEPGTRLMLELGELILVSDYLRALQIRACFKESVKQVFEDNNLDVLVTPSSPITTVPLDQLSMSLGGDTGETALYALIHHFAPFNLSGQPSISIPSGFSEERLPLGIQIIGRPLGEAMVFRVAQAYESATDWHTHSPPL